MGDSLEILESAAHANVTSVMSGVTPQLLGLRAGAVPLAQQVKGDVIDVADYSTLRVTLALAEMTNRAGFEAGLHDSAKLYVTLEHAPAENGPWSVLHAFEPMNNPGSQQVPLAGFFGNVRASWWFSRTDQSATITEQVAFTFGVTADAIPATE